MKIPGWKQSSRVKTPSVLQMEALECGAACLKMIMAHFGLHVPLESVRVECGVSRDGSKASNIVKAARARGMKARGVRCEVDQLKSLPSPLILHWNMNHFVVFEGFGRGKAYLNDPAVGHRQVDMDEFNRSFSGIALCISPGDEFCPGGTPRQSWKGLWRRLKNNPLSLASAFIAEILLVIPMLLIPVFAKIYIDNILVQGQLSWFRPLIFFMIGNAVLIGLLTYLRQMFMLRLQARLAIHQGSLFFNHILRLPVRFYMQRFPGDLTKRVEHNDEVAVLLSGEIARTVTNIVVILAYLGLMLNYSPPLTMISVTAVLLTVIMVAFFSSHHKEVSDLMATRAGKSYSYASGSIFAIESIKANGAEADVFSKWAGHYAHVVNCIQRQSIISSLVTIVPALLASLTIILVLILGAVFVINGEITVGMLVAFQAMTLAFLNPFNQIIQLVSHLNVTQASIDRLDDVLMQKQAPTFLAGGEEHMFEKTKLSGRIDIENLNFGYSPLEPPLLTNVSLSLQAGQRIALVGASGSGKSTLARLLAGLDEPWSGNIHFDGFPLKAIPRNVFTHSLAFVDQSTSLFQGTILDNLTLWDRSIPFDPIIEATRDACIHDILSARQGGYHSPVEEAGRNFSGGQQQRIEIARALVNHPTVLILDEATSALDAITEKIIDDNLRRRGCSCIIVAHRLSTIRDADEIIVLERGRIAERGTHDSLLAQEGLYAGLIATM